MVICELNGGITLGTKFKMAIFTLYYPMTYKVGFWYFRNLCIRDTVSNKTYQNFHDKRLLRPGSLTQFDKDLTTHKLQDQIFTDRKYIYIADFKYNITYQNVLGETRVRPIFIT